MREGGREGVRDKTVEGEERGEGVRGKTEEEMREEGSGRMGEELGEEAKKGGRGR